MEETIEARVSPEIVWKTWAKMHAIQGNGPKKFKCKILDVIEGRQFSVLWKSLFVRLIFTYSVQEAKAGSQVRCTAVIKGFFAWPVRMMLQTKIQKNISFALKEFVKQLEKQSKA